MKGKVGLWIDHKKAVIVSIESDGEHIEVIKSNIERHVRLSGGSRAVTPYSRQDVVSNGRRDRKFMHHVELYYHKVIQAIRDAETLFIFGPGPAKREFKKEIEKSKELASHIAGLESVDKMTQPQVAAKVREYYADQNIS
jgi:stalled ribosome rescue protein Dom34